jgi:hypothetical protein
MKRLWIALAILIFLFGTTLLNVFYLSRLTEELAGLLIEAERQAEDGQWERAEELTKQAQSRWDAQTGYLYVVLRHSDTDQVHIGFREVLEFIYCQEGGEYSAANAKLVAQIELLHEMETLTLQNLL